MRVAFVVACLGGRPLRFIVLVFCWVVFGGGHHFDYFGFHYQESFCGVFCVGCEGSALVVAVLVDA